MTNVANTIWQPGDNQEGEYTITTAVDIMDPADSSILLIDPSAVFIVDTGLLYASIPNTTWLASDGS